MLTYGLPIAATLFIWWFSTGAILFLDGLPKRTFRWSMLIATLLALASLFALSFGKADDSESGVYLAFVSAMMIWAWNEMAFLMGYITGPRRTACPPEARGMQRFVFATQSIIYHELAIVASALAILWLTTGGVNQIGLWTFLLLWLMRLSTKLNIFLGVSNTTVEFLPAHLAYLKSYFAHKPMNLLFPFSVTLSTVLLAILIGHVSAGASGSAMTTGYVLLATLVALALIEHWFLVVPLPFGELWSWGLSSRQGDEDMTRSHKATTAEAKVLVQARQTGPDTISKNVAQATVH